MRRTYRSGDAHLSATYHRRSPNEIEVLTNETTTALNVEARGQRLIIETKTKKYHAITARNKDKIFVWLDGRVHELQETEETSDVNGHDTNRDDICAPMPGMIIKLDVSIGDTVQADQIVAVLEAMKMEHNLRAPRAGKIARVDVKVGQTVSADAPLVHLEGA